MASTQLAERLGMNNDIYEHDVPINVGRSSFPLSNKREFHLDAGMIVPIRLIETLPKDVFDISVEYILKSFPLVVAPFTSYKVRTHWYYCKLSDLWRGAQTMLTKGNDGSLSLSVPTLNPYTPLPSFISGESNDVVYDTPQSLASYFRFASGHVPLVQSTDNGYNEPYAQCCNPSSAYSTAVSNVSAPYGGVSVLPFLMYQKIYRFAYQIPNLLQNNKVWYPNDLTDGWRINYSKTNLSANGCFFVPDGSVPTITTSNSPAPSASVSDEAVNLLQLRYGLFERDRFTSALPWAQRGSAPTISVSNPVEMFDSLGNKIILDGTSGSGDDLIIGSSSEFASTTPDYDDNLLDKSYKGSLYLYARDSPNSSSYHDRSFGLRTDMKFDLNQFRELIALTVWQERNAMIQAGDYNQFIYAHYRTNPHVDTHEPVYIGGTSDTIYFGDVIQTSETTANSPLGKQAGLAQVQSRGRVGHFVCPDFGYIMGVMIISPETSYSQGIQKLWTRLTQEDFYFPEDEGLGLEEILNKEIFPQGTSSDNDLFGYNERNTEYKAAENESVGFFSLPGGIRDDLSAYSQIRHFSSLPALSHQFVTMSPENMRRDYLVAPSMPAFRVSFATILRGVRPMSYRNIPQTFGF